MAAQSPTGSGEEPSMTCTCEAGVGWDGRMGQVRGAGCRVHLLWCCGVHLRSSMVVWAGRVPEPVWGGATGWGR